jgi:NADH-quinone oxidoreductase subunit N
MNTLYALAPLIIIVSGALVVMLLEVFILRKNKDYLGYISILFLLFCGYICLSFLNRNHSYFGGRLVLDNLALFLGFILILGTLLVILISMKYISLQGMNVGEYYTMMLLALSGMFIMISTSDLLVIFLGLEVLSISSYVLAGLKRGDQKSSEAAVKYFLLGSFASAFIVFGLALLYGASQSTQIGVMISAFSSPSALGLAGLSLLIIGFGFKIAVVPFHMWTPDVYEGSPTPVTAFFSIGPKTVGFAVLIRLFYPYWVSAADSKAVFVILWVIAALTMIIGNLIALRQTNVKRILAYSSIAHAGYILIAILARDYTGLVFYLTVYLFMNIGAFSAVIAMGKKGEEYVSLDDYAGIGFKYPWIGATFTVFLISLAGFPPTGGFLAKFYIFSSAVGEGLIPLVIIAVLASAVSVYYYLRIVVVMYFKQPVRDISIHAENPALFFVLFFCLYGVLQMGIYPGNVLALIRQVVASLPLF